MSFKAMQTDRRQLFRFSHFSIHNPWSPIGVQRDQFSDQHILYLFHHLGAFIVWVSNVELQSPEGQVNMKHGRELKKIVTSEQEQLTVAATFHASAHIKSATICILYILSNLCCFLVFRPHNWSYAFWCHQPVSTYFISVTTGYWCSVFVLTLHIKSLKFVIFH